MDHLGMEERTMHLQDSAEEGQQMPTSHQYSNVEEIL